MALQMLFRACGLEEIVHYKSGSYYHFGWCYCHFGSKTQAPVIPFTWFILRSSSEIKKSALRFLKANFPCETLLSFIWFWMFLKACKTVKSNSLSAQGTRGHFQQDGGQTAQWPSTQGRVQFCIFYGCFKRKMIQSFEFVKSIYPSYHLGGLPARSRLSLHTFFQFAHLQHSPGR